MKTLKYKLTGVTPMMHSNPQSADPLNKWAILKSKSKKRGKTEEDILENRRIDFLASIHFNEEERYFVPAEMVWSSIWEASKSIKMGKKIEKGLVIMSNCPISFKHSKVDPESLYNYPEHVDVRLTKNKINNTMITASHVIYPKWQIEVDCIIDESMLNESDIDNFIEYASKYCGLGSKRPRYGRFEVEKI